MKDVLSLTLQDSQTFYRQYYQPKNAVLIVSGDATVPQVKALAEKYYGPIANDADAVALPTLPPAPPVKPIRTELVDARVQTPLISKVYRIPSFASPQWRESLGLSFFNTIIGGGAESQLYKALVLSQKLATQVGAYSNSNTIGEGVMTIYAVPNPGVSMAKLEAALDTEIANILRNGITQAELDRDVKRGYANLVYTLDNHESLVRELGVGLMMGQSPAEVFDTKAWRTMTVDEIMAAARKYIVAERAVTGVLLRNETDRTGVQP
jgi:zinc protease